MGGTTQLLMLATSPVKALFPRLLTCSFGSNPLIKLQPGRFKSSGFNKFTLSISNEYENNECVKEVFDNYVEIGKTIRRNSSNFYKNFDDIIENHGKSSLLLDDLGHRHNESEYRSSLNEFFIALVSPSLTGKTQAAFAIKSKLPLYFVFGSDQTIYEPFSELSQNLRQLAEEDVVNVKKYLVKAKKWPKKSDDLFNISLIDLKLSKVKLKSLGLLRALFEEADAFESDQMGNKRDDWMYHFVRSREISYEPITIRDYINESLQKQFQFERKYCLFLDEFKGDQELVFIRNLCRYLNFSCVVSSTNFEVSNPIGLSPEATSRGLGRVAWSAVFDNLESFTPELLESNVEYNDSIKILIESALRISEKEGHRMNLLAKYLAEQCLASRPGLSHIIMESVCQLKPSENLNADNLFENLIGELFISLNTRKPEAFSGKASEEAYCRIANGRHFENSYFESDDKDSSPLIDQHFFHLSNPNKPPEGPFLLSKVILYKQPCLTISNGKIFDIKSYFNPNEELLMLACLFPALEHSTRSVIRPSSATTPLNESSNALAIIKSGNDLENVVLQAINDASHGGTLGA